MASKIRRLGIVVALTMVILLGIVLLALSYSEVGVTCEIGTGGLPLSAHELSLVPQSVAEDATKLAIELYGDSQEKYDDFVNQLLATYLDAKDKDFIIFFNSGGWGSNIVEASPGWWSIFTGIQSELSSSGYTSLLLNYRRTVEGLRGCLDELVELLTHYPSKAEDLAYRVEFLTDHVSDLRVILAGESNGTVICDSAMNILEGNPQVYSIQTGPPFWHGNVMLDKTLLLTSNGIIPDSFSQCDFSTVACANIKAWFGLSKPEDDSSKILHWIRAPGHDYRWQYPEVYSKITDFLDENFGIKW